MSISEKIKAYFSKREITETSETSPQGMCPVCWGESEWDGEYFEIIKDKHAKTGDDIYDSFISKIVDDHVLTTHNLKGGIVCTTCDKTI